MLHSQVNPNTKYIKWVVRNYTLVIKSLSMILPEQRSVMKGGESERERKLLQRDTALFSCQGCFHAEVSVSSRGKVVL